MTHVREHVRRGRSGNPSVVREHVRKYRERGSVFQDPKRPHPELTQEEVEQLLLEEYEEAAFRHDITVSDAIAADASFKVAAGGFDSSPEGRKLSEELFAAAGRVANGKGSSDDRALVQRQGRIVIRMNEVEESRLTADGKYAPRGESAKKVARLRAESSLFRKEVPF